MGFKDQLYGKKTDMKAKARELEWAQLAPIAAKFLDGEHVLNMLRTSKIDICKVTREELKKWQKTIKSLI